VLVACERSGVVRNAFRARGHEAWSCDLEPADDGERHWHQQRDGETKATCLWLKNLPVPTNIVDGREQRIWKMGPGENRKRDRSRTYEGIAAAMAAQWSGGRTRSVERFAA
jgi:hypothetical protein